MVWVVVVVCVVVVGAGLVVVGVGLVVVGVAVVATGVVASFVGAVGCCPVLVGVVEVAEPMFGTVGVTAIAVIDGGGALCCAGAEELFGVTAGAGSEGAAS